ncbi:MAG: hypothetical protein OK436_05065 [Thaumarchaeota archaeon]|nr:hypothetical protein [Nitrososphaerota archaeon]
MARIRLTPEFLGDLGELYFKHLCQQRDYGYIRLERLHRTLPNPILEFTHRFERIPVMLPEEILDEVTRVSKPTPVNGTNSYVFDFLTTKVYELDSVKYPNKREPDDFCWVEIKTGNSKLSTHQFEVANSCKVRFSLFRITNAFLSPRQVEIDWAFDSLRGPPPA